MKPVSDWFIVAISFISSSDSVFASVEKQRRRSACTQRVRQVSHMRELPRRTQYVHYLYLIHIAYCKR